MEITRRHLVQALGTIGAGLSTAGCLTFDGADSTETPAATATPTPATGWATQIPETPPNVSCSAASRPMAEPVDRKGALAARRYPGRPPSEPAGEGAVEYATAFELAYRQNAEMLANTDMTTDGESDSYLTQFDISVQNFWVASGPANSAVVRLQYVGSGTIHPGTDFDYITQYVTYYIGSTRVVRARTTRNDFDGADALDPDPWENGNPVACFEGEGRTPSKLL
ncbi:hypothetical protein BVU17_14115 [Haloarcula taiwanensis]|uniref:Uncharacterized protein n=1 Tax=Haloarcula taiwanensis TaxID=1932004 RepID=A0A2H5A1J2_9EURY|nr:hypothetical protein [Haloarcula taiwanensis]AUG48603.1 hypothetical protein BVU17_14115 [Haloarcula taiwanensis]